MPSEPLSRARLRSWARKTPIAKRATAMNGSHVPSVFRRR